MHHYGAPGSRGGGGPLQGSLMGLTNILAILAALVGSPMIYEASAPYFLELARRNYGYDMVDLMDMLWFVLMFPATFFLARAAFFVALTSAATFTALRFA